MSPIISEEDVLASLVLRAARPVVTNCYSTAQLDERDAWNAATGADLRATYAEQCRQEALRQIVVARLQGMTPLEVAIADSERRLAVEEAIALVLGAVLAWRDGKLGADDVDASAIEYEGALAEVARHAGR